MNITAGELKAKLSNSESVKILDVREELEFHTFNIGGENIPLGILLREIEDLDYTKEEEIIVVCQRGLRSETARRALASHGFANVKNLSGGLLAWRRFVE
ncbi:MAG: rhodanese-like domain-containing protein [Daejeonella sp.]